MMQFIPIIFCTKPPIPEFDFSGTIAQLGSGVSSRRNLKVDAAVFGSIPLGSLVKAGQGALAEYVVVPADNVCVAPVKRQGLLPMRFGLHNFSHKY